MGQLLGRSNDAGFDDVEMLADSTRAVSSRKRKNSGDDEMETRKKKISKLDTAKYIHKRLFIDGAKSDVTIRALGRTWNLHRLYLEQCKFFDRLFRGHWKDSNNSVIQIDIVDPNVTVEGFNMVLESLYHNEIELDLDHVSSLIASASMLSLDSVMERCAELCAESLTDERVIEFHTLAEQYGLPELSGKCFNYLKNNFWRLSNKPTILYTVSHSTMAKLMAASDLLVVEGELDLYETIKKWIFLQAVPYAMEYKDISGEMEKYYSSLTVAERDALCRTFADITCSIRIGHIVSSVKTIGDLRKDPLVPNEIIDQVLADNWLLLLRNEETKEMIVGNKHGKFLYDSSIRTRSLRIDQTVIIARFAPAAEEFPVAVHFFYLATLPSTPVWNYWKLYMKNSAATEQYREAEGVRKLSGTHWQKVKRCVMNKAKQVQRANNSIGNKKYTVEPVLNYDAPFKALMQSSQLRDLDLVKWLENKLGDNSELWCGRQAASLLSREMLVELETCFQALEPHIKLKIVLAVPHLSYRLTTMWKEPLVNLLDLARRDADDWIETVSDMLRYYPGRHCITPIPTNLESFFCKSLDELRKMVRKHEGNNHLRLLPPDLGSMSQSAIKVILFTSLTNLKFQTLFGLNEIENRKHFNLKRRAKSYTLKADLLKSVEVGNNRTKTQKVDVVPASFPIRMRSTVRKPNNDLPMRGIPTISTCKLSSGFTNEPRKFQRQLTRREGGAKFIDIGDLPQALSVRRKEQEAEERARKNQEREEQRKRAQVEKVTKEAKRAAIAVEKAKEAAAVAAAAAVDEVTAAVNGTAIRNNVNLNGHDYNNSVNGECTDSRQDSNQDSSQDSSQPSSSYGDVRDLPTLQSEQSDDSDLSPTAAQLSRRESFARRQCDEMLACANVLNDEGRRMVIAFMSGNKVHPYPHLGDLLTLKLSETYEDEHRSDGNVHKTRVETFFQMDYRTGEWRRLRKTRALRPEEIPTLHFMHTAEIRPGS